MTTYWLKDDRFTMNGADFELFHNYTDQSVTTEYHTHDFLEILFFLSGSVEYMVENRCYHLRPGDIIFTNQSELHRTIIKKGKDYERYVLWIRPDFIRRINLLFPDLSLMDCFDSSKETHHNLIRPKQDQTMEIFHLLEKLSISSANTWKDTLLPVNSVPSENTALTLCHFAELLILLNQTHRTTLLTNGVHVVSNPKIDEIIFYINNHLNNELSLDFLAQEFYISKYYLSHLFKENMGISLHQYIRNKRLLLAKHLLISGCTPYFACMEAGFHNYSNFSRGFKQFFGQAPSDFSAQLF